MSVIVSVNVKTYKENTEDITELNNRKDLKWRKC